MAFFLGPGGAGDATADATSQATLATSKAAEAAASAASALTSASVASVAAANTVDFKNALTVEAVTLIAGSDATAVYNPSTTHIIFGIPTASGEGGGGTAGVTSFNARTGAVTLVGSDVTTALTYTPYNATNPSGYITVGGAPVQSVASKTGAVTLDKSDVGLANVDNTSDVSKPVSTAQQTALDAKQATLVSATNIKTINGASILGSGDITVASGGVSSFNTRTGAISLTSADVTTALTYTPYNSTNPAGYTTNTGTVTSVAFSGGTTGLTASGGPVTSSGTLTLDGTLAVANGGTGATTAGAALTSLGAYAASNPSGYTSNVGTVTSIAGTGSVNGITLTGSVSSTGSLTLGGTLANVSLSTQVTGTLPIANGGTGATSSAAALTALGAYPSTNPSGYTSNTGTVTSVTATAPVSSTGGTTPILSMAAATASVDGYLTATDFTTFNGKQAALVSGTNIKTINGTSVLGSGDITVSAGVVVSDTAPSSPIQGQEWEDSTSGIKYTYIIDDTSSAWVELGPSGASISGGSSGITTGKSIAMAIVFGG